MYVNEKRGSVGCFLKAWTTRGLMGICDIFKNVRGDCFSNQIWISRSPLSFQRPHFEKSLPLNGFQKLSVALVPFVPPWQVPRLKFCRGTSETLSPSCFSAYTVYQITIHWQRWKAFRITHYEHRYKPLLLDQL